MPSKTAYKFLASVLGSEGSEALEKACGRIPDLDTVLLPRSVLAWLNFLAPHGFEGKIPGTESTLKLQKDENGYAGEVVWNGNKYLYKDANLYKIAAAIALAIGAKAKEVNPEFKTDDLTILGKSIDMLVKTHAANEQLRKAEPPGRVAAGQKPLAPVPAGPPTSAKTGGSSVQAVPQPVSGQVDPKAIKLPGMGKKTVKPAIKLPSLKIGKSELSAVCNICGEGQFNQNTFIGCTCLKVLAKSVKTEVKPDGLLLSFSNKWTLDDIDSLRTLIYGDDNER